MELWDVYDKKRRLTGRTHERGVPLGADEYHVVADVWTVNLKSLILLTKRHPDKPYGLFWECTGGSVLAGEKSVSGAVRELSEEVGIHAAETELTLIHSICLKERFVDTYITRQDVSVEDLTLQAEEVVDAMFVEFYQLMDMWSQGLVVPKSRFLLYKEAIETFL